MNSGNFPPSDQVSGVIMCCWFQRCVVMKVDGCGWKGGSLPHCQVPFFHLNSISYSAHVDGAYCWLLILVSIAQRITLQSVHTSPHIPLRLATSALVQASATRKWTAVVEIVALNEVMWSILSWESWGLMKMLMFWPYSPMQTYFYGNVAIRMPFLIFAYSKSIKANVLTASCAK